MARGCKGGAPCDRNAGETGAQGRCMLLRPIRGEVSTSVQLLAAPAGRRGRSNLLMGAAGGLAGGACEGDINAVMCLVLSQAGHKGPYQTQRPDRALFELPLRPPNEKP